MNNSEFIRSINSEAVDGRFSNRDRSLSLPNNFCWGDTRKPAMLGALVMQSLQSGMQLMGIESPLQKIVSGLVLVLAVGIDTWYRKRTA